MFAMPNGTTSKTHHPHSSADFQGNSGRPDCLVSGSIRFGDEESANLWSPCSNCSSSDENNSPTAINSINWDKPALEDKSVDFGWTASSDSKYSFRKFDRIFSVFYRGLGLCSELRNVDED